MAASAQRPFIFPGPSSLRCIDNAANDTDGVLRVNAGEGRGKGLQHYAHIAARLEKSSIVIRKRKGNSSSAAMEGLTCVPPSWLDTTALKFVVAQTARDHEHSGEIVRRSRLKQSNRDFVDARGPVLALPAIRAVCTVIVWSCGAEG
jgi:hypothetical protein